MGAERYRKATELISFSDCWSTTLCMHCVRWRSIIKGNSQCSIIRLKEIFVWVLMPWTAHMLSLIYCKWFRKVLAGNCALSIFCNLVTALNKTVVYKLVVHSNRCRIFGCQTSCMFPAAALATCNSAQDATVATKNCSGQRRRSSLRS